MGESLSSCPSNFVDVFSIESSLRFGFDGFFSLTMSIFSMGNLSWTGGFAEVCVPLVFSEEPWLDNHKASNEELVEYTPLLPTSLLLEGA